MSDHLLAPEDVRRRLEGRLETVEAARVHYRALQGRLEERQWRRRLGQQPGLLDEVAARETDVEAALAAIQQLAQREDWPRAHPVLATVREVLRRRDRLDALLDQRLESRPSPETPAPSRGERLSRLRALCVRNPVPDLVPGEILLTQDPAPPFRVPFSAQLVGLGLFVLSSLSLGIFAGLVVGVVMCLLPAFRYRQPRSTRYWLTPERLVWESAPGERTQVLLRDIPPHGVSAPFPDTLLVSGPHETFVLGLGRDTQRSVLTALELHRRAPLFGHATPQPLPDVVCFPATFQAGRLRAGCAILRPGFLAFLPEDRLGDVFQAVTGAPRTGLPLDLRHVVEALRHLPTGAGFDACLERAVAQADGVLWSPNACVRYDTQLPVWKRLHFKNFDVPAKSLSGAVDRRAQDAVERILAAWPRR